MRKNYPKIIILTFVMIELLVTFSSYARAQDDTVTGKAYAMYFLSFPKNNFNLDEAGLTHLDVTFKEDGGVAIMEMDGHGLYVALPGFFAATYYIVGLRMGFESMDVFTSMSGLIINPLIFGVGFFLVDYTQIQPYVFSGLMMHDMDSISM